MSGARRRAAGIRIAIAHTQLTTLGGGERATLELARRLGERHPVTIWTTHYAADETFAEFARVPMRITPSAAWLAQPLDADVIVAQNFGARLLALRHRQVIAYTHTMRSRYLRGSLRPDLAARRALDRRAMARAVYTLTNSAFTAARAAAAYGRAPDVVSPGAEERYFTLPPSVGSYALYVGRLAPEKGVARLLQWHAGADVPLEVVGPGALADRARLTPLAAASGAQMRGPLTGEALATYYSGARFFAFTPYAEEFGLAALDAMAAAKPVIAIADGALPELVQDGVTGFLVRDAGSYQRAAEQLMTDPALCLRMGLAARERARAYTWERFARRIEALCEQAATSAW